MGGECAIGTADAPATVTTVAPDAASAVPLAFAMSFLPVMTAASRSTLAVDAFKGSSAREGGGGGSFTAGDAADGLGSPYAATVDAAGEAACAAATAARQIVIDWPASASVAGTSFAISSDDGGGGGRFFHRRRYRGACWGGAGRY